MAQSAQIKIPATYMRGGTSKGVFFHKIVNYMIERFPLRVF